MTWRVLIRDHIAAEAEQVFQDQAEVVFSDDLEQIDQYDAMLIRSATKVDAELITRAAQLKVIGRAGVGVDNIDLKAAEKHGLVVVNAPQAASQAVAEHALGLMLALARKIPSAAASMKAGRWEKKRFKGVELQGRVLGILGVGRIGTLLAEKASALGMQSVGYDAYLSEAEIEERGVQPVSILDLLTRSDFVSVHVPLTDSTRGLIGPDELAQMKPGAYIISTARGGVVDEAALLQALERGELTGAALDVFQREPPVDSPLVGHESVICTPHIAAQTEEAQRRAAIDVAEEVLAALQGNPLRWRVI
ncbi:MAG: hydroxyacid dehydrogenase [Anaerolineales bacterium]|jgi:D-3-phosphoglycerate dehydrogenase